MPKPSTPAIIRPAPGEVVDFSLLMEWIPAAVGGNSPPSASLVSPAAGAAVTAGAPMLLSATATDPDGSVASVHFFVDGVNVGAATYDAGTARWSRAFTPAAGAHVVYARALDNAGAPGVSAPVAFTAGATVVPVPVLNPPVVNADRSITMAAASDQGQNGRRWYRGGQLVGTTAGNAGFVDFVPSAPSSTPLSGHDFNDGGIGPFSQWGGYTAQPVSVIPDPTGSGRGMVAKIAYARPANSTGGRDVNGGLYVPQGNPVLGATFGDTRYLEHDLWLPQYPGGAPTMPEEDQRKLWYVKFGIQGGPRVGGFYPVLWGRVDGSGMELHFINEDNITLGPPFILYSVARLNWATWYKLAMAFQLNHEGVADGRVRLWLNGELLMDLVNFELVKAGAAGSAANIYEWGIGNQEQWAEDETVDMDDYRIVDNIRFLTAPPAELEATSAPASLLLADTWAGGTWGPIATPTQGDPADYAIVDLPSWMGGGKGARIHYHRDSTSDPELDKNRCFFITGAGLANYLGTGMTWGGELYVEFDLGFDVPTFSGFAPEFMQAKVVYCKFGNPDTGRYDWVLNTWGRTNGSGMDLSVHSGAHSQAPDLRIRPQELGAMAWQTKYRIGFYFRLNSGPSAFDGRVELWQDGVFRYGRTTKMADDPTGLYHTLFEVAIGDQEQGNTSTNASLFSHYRYFKNLRVYNRRPGS